MDAESCSESSQDSDVVGSGCKGSVEDIVEFLSHCTVGR